VTATTYKILLENTAEGKALAMVLELPDCRVTAETISEALSEIRQQLIRRLAKAEVITIDIATIAEPIEHPMLKFAGIFKDDDDFVAVMSEIQAERSERVIV
jgi:hypothetical protein